MLRRALLLALPTCVALAFAAPALADTTVGATGTPDASSSLVAGFENVNPAAVVPAPGTITSLETQSATSDVCANLGAGEYDFQVLRPEGNNQYQVLGDTGNQADPCDGQLHAYPVTISVQPADVLGVYVINDWAGLLIGGGRDYNAVPEPAVGQTINLPNPGTNTIDLSATLVPLSDSDLALTNVPSDVTADATSPAGAMVTYQLPTAVDEDAAQVSCSPASGATFSIGTTTVTCTATDSDDSNSPAQATFTVYVEGATEQLSDLASQVTDLGPGRSLADKLAWAQLYLDAGHPGAACAALDAFSFEVWAQADKKIPLSTALTLTDTARQIREVIGCRFPRLRDWFVEDRMRR